MPTYGFLIDNRKCIGCHACTVACKSEHEVPIGVDRTWVKYVEKGTFPQSRRLFTVMRCNHCDAAPCVSICPVTSLYRREDGVVDFNSDRCIGCKSCMQACPYDALFIDPNNNTAAKCNYCTHRLEVGLEPSCVVVCPEQAIVAGDLDDQTSNLSQLIDRHPVQVRKPEKGTRPKLFYIDGDEAALVPNRTTADGNYMWSGGTAEGHTGGDTPTSQQPRRAYDVRPRKVAWGWPVVAYTWTKSVAAGSAMAALAASLLADRGLDRATSLWLGAVGLVFLAITCALLVMDLKRPDRFLYVLLRPQWKSWLVRGAYLLMAYGVLLTIWFACVLFGADRAVTALLWPNAIAAMLAAVYTAFLFAQAKGRDFWQNPLLSFHLLTHAILCGGVLWIMAATQQGQDVQIAKVFTLCALTTSLLAIFSEVVTTHGTEDARRTMRMILSGERRVWFWGVGVIGGHVLPALFLFLPADALAWLAGLLIFVGMIAIEWLWVDTPQRIPLS